MYHKSSITQDVVLEDYHLIITQLNIIPKDNLTRKGGS